MKIFPAPIVFRAVRKTYGAVPALIDLSYEFPANQITCIVGRSGSGKSTLLKLINGVEQPDAGEIRVFDEPLNYRRITSVRRRLGYAVQGTGLFPHLSVRRNIELPGVIAQWPADKRRERSSQLLRLVNLEEQLADRYPFELSGGQQQRAGLCRAMFLDPAVFLLDEPFGALDPITRSEIQEEFLALQQKLPRTIVLVTHDMREAVKLGENILILESGRLVQHGRREEVLSRPATPFVRQLIHSQLSIEA